MLLVTLMWSMAGVITRHLESAQSFEVTFWRSFFTGLALAAYYAVVHGRDTPRLPVDKPCSRKRFPARASIGESGKERADFSTTDRAPGRLRRSCAVPSEAIHPPLVGGSEIADMQYRPRFPGRGFPRTRTRGRSPAPFA